MPNGYTAPIVDGKNTRPYDYMMSVGRSRGFAVHQRENSLSEPVKHRVPSDYHERELAEAESALSAWLATSNDEKQKAYREYVSRVVESNQASIARAAAVAARIAFVRDSISTLTAPEELQGTLDDAIRYLDETEEWDAKPYTQRVMPFNEWLEYENHSKSRDVTYHQEQLAAEQQRCLEANGYIDKFYEMIEPLKDLDISEIT